METKTMTPLRYLKKILGFSSKEWLELSDEDRKDLREAADKEIELLKEELDAMEEGVI